MLDEKAAAEATVDRASADAAQARARLLELRGSGGSEGAEGGEGAAAAAIKGGGAGIIAGLDAQRVVLDAQVAQKEEELRRLLATPLPPPPSPPKEEEEEEEEEEEKKPEEEEKDVAAAELAPPLPIQITHRRLMFRSGDDQLTSVHLSDLKGVVKLLGDNLPAKLVIHGFSGEFLGGCGGVVAACWLMY